MEIYLLTALFIVYSLAAALCSQVGFPRAAKLGFLLVVAGLVVMNFANAFAFLGITSLWSVPLTSEQDIDQALSAADAAILVSQTSFAAIVFGGVLSCFSMVKKILAERKRLFCIHKEAAQK